MTLAAGSRLGAHEITAPLGAGGMGEVYRATDTRLGREVAIKVLPAEVAGDAERLARFEREAKLLASLNHPNIAHVYGFESATLPDGASAHFLAMELVDGEDLAERLKRGAIPVEEALEIAKQIAEALEEAHEHGIVHRDLKPANVKVTSDGKVKVLDFGLAKAYSGEAASGSTADLSRSPTLAHTGTQAGVILGTAAYMSPEQARGKAVDKRADIWAFGVVLWEMLTGKQLFAGETVSDVLAAVLTREIGWSELPPRSSRGLRRLLERCLERNPQRRLRDIGEARLALSDLDAWDREPAAGTTRSWPRGLALVATGLAAGALLTGLWSRSREAGGAPLAVHFVIDARDAVPATVSIAPNGKRLAFTQSGLGAPGMLWWRRLDEVVPQQLAGTQGAFQSFWSPDGRRVAVSTGSELKVLDVDTGATARTLSLSPPESRGGTWGPGDVMLYGGNGGIYRVGTDGTPSVLVLEPRKGESAWLGWPAFLPDGQRYLFTSQVREGDRDVPVVQVADLASPGNSRVVLRRAMGAFWSNGYLVYGVEAGGLYAQPVDPTSLEPVGAPVLLAQDVDVDARRGYVAACGSANGVVAFRRGSIPQREFVWVDRTGRKLGKASGAGPWHNFDLSPDGKQIATTTVGRTQGNHLWLIEPGRNVATELSGPNTPSVSDPTWSPDGRLLAMRLGDSLVVQPARGGEARVLHTPRGYPDSFSPDGKWLLFGMAARLGSYELFAIDTSTTGSTPVPLVTGLRLADEPRFAPNGSWIAYHAGTGSGEATEVFVIPFPTTGERWQVSSAGGVQPRWSPRGDALYYLDPAGRLMSVSMPGSDPRKASAPEPLFDTGLLASNAYDQYAVAPDGRFLLQLPIEGSQPAAPVHVLLGWGSKGSGTTSRAAEAQP